MKRKLKDLKENECIKVNTLAQAKYFIEKIGFNVMPSVIVGKVILKEYGNSHHFVWRNDEEIIDSVERVAASDFIKPKRSVMKKALKKFRKMNQQLTEVGKNTEAILEVLNGKNEPIGNSEQLGVSSKIEHAELKVGKWYKFESGALQFNADNGRGYGIDSGGDWCDNVGWLMFPELNPLLSEATPEEVGEALIKEAERRGYTKNNFHSLVCTSDSNFDGWFFSNKENRLYTAYMNKGGKVVFKDGVWAEIIETEEIDWSKPGQLVQNKYGCVRVTSGMHSGELFESTLLISASVDKSDTFRYDTDCVKSAFKPYKGTITLKND